MLKITRSVFVRHLLTSSQSLHKTQDRGMSKFWFVQYDYVPNIVEKRVPFRVGHLTYAKKYREDGRLIIGGAFNPPEAAAIVFKVNDKKEVEDFVRNDPYVLNGLVEKYHIKEWNIVISSIDDSNLKL